MEDHEFPPITINENQSQFFRDELVFFYFHFTRVEKYNDFSYFSNRYDIVLHQLKKHMSIDKHNTLPYLVLFYKLYSLK